MDGKGIYLSILFVLMLTSCSDEKNALKPQSGGRPYEVIVEEDRDSIIYKALTEDMEGLPQAEHSFDVSMVYDKKYPSAARLARNIVRVNIDSNAYTLPQIRYEKDVAATPQIRIHVNAPSVQALQKSVTRIAPSLRQLLVRSEMNVAIKGLKAHHNAKAQKEVEKMFGMQIWIPEALTSCKKGKNFIWLSNNSAQGMANICVYSYNALRLDAKELIEKRDSIMRLNVPGEEPDMYMQTVEKSVKPRFIKERSSVVLTARGLWEMKNDMMGGPFVAHAIVDSIKKRVVVAEAFVFAPESKKRNKIRQLEASLYTLKRLRKL